MKIEPRVVFPLVCFPVRAVLAAIAFGGITKKSFLVGWILKAFLLVVAIGFAVLALTGARTSGAETGGEPIWWRHIRPVHALTYAAAFACMSSDKHETAGILLMLDAAFGLGMHVAKRHLC